MIALRGMHADLRPYAEYAHQLGRAYGITPTVTSVFRSWTKQRQLRDRYEYCLATGEFGRTARCRYPANRPGESSHNYGLSWDSVVSDAEMPLWAQIRSYVGFRVPQNDLIHAELPSWRSYVR